MYTYDYIADDVYHHFYFFCTLFFSDQFLSTTMHKRQIVLRVIQSAYLQLMVLCTLMTRLCSWLWIKPFSSILSIWLIMGICLICLWAKYPSTYLLSLCLLKKKNRHYFFTLDRLHYGMPMTQKLACCTCQITGTQLTQSPHTHIRMMGNIGTLA